MANVMVSFPSEEALRAAHDLIGYGWDCTEEDEYRELPDGTNEAWRAIEEGITRLNEREAE